MKIKYISVRLTSKGINEKNSEFDCKKSTTGYIVDVHSNFDFDGKITRVNKSEILKVDSLVTANLHDTIQFYTWYFAEQEQKAKEIVYNKLKKVATEQYKTALKLFNLIKNK